MIVEVAGLAGSGKTTLSRMLCQQASQTFVPGARLRPRSGRHLPYVLRQGFWLLPTLLHSLRASPSLTRDEIKKLAYLAGWHRVLKRQGDDANAVIVVDQGAIFKLATLYGFGPEWLRGKRFEKRWGRLFDQWSAVLQMVVFLEAPIDVHDPEPSVS